jgi:predicted secreted hydrolase
MNAPHGQEDARGFHFKVGNWEMAHETGKDRLKADAPEFTLALALEDTAPPVIHGTTGLLDFGEAGKSYYYSRTPMKTRGELIYAGKAHTVTGQAWFDHQWGHFKISLLQYDWIALKLRDGIEVMLYQLSDPEGKQIINTGTYIQDGQAEELKGEDFTARPSLNWPSPSTGIRYPIKWQIQIPQKRVDVVITPVIEGGEFDSRTTTYHAYWEGAVRATGSHPGVGFLEVARKK